MLIFATFLIIFRKFCGLKLVIYNTGSRIKARQRSVARQNRPTPPVTESREYGNPIPSQNASLSNNYNITSAVHNCMCAFQFARERYARTLRTSDMLTLFCKLRKTKNFWRNSKDSWFTKRAAKILLMRTKSDPRIYATKNSRTVWKRCRAI